MYSPWPSTIWRNSMLNYEMEEKIKRELNILNMRRQLATNKTDNQLLVKIDAFCEKFNLDVDFVKNKIINDDLFILHFIKDPQKQSFHQGLAFNYLKRITGFYNAVLLPSNGSEALYVSNGNVLSGKNLTTSNIGKSIDFRWDVKDNTGKTITCYATHKHTKTAGGSQDNQFRDVESFIKQAQYCNSKSIYFFAICDGAYYKTHYNNSSSKIEYLNSTYKTGAGRIATLTINDIEDFIREKF